MLNENYIINCACGCGTEFYKFDSKNRPRKYVHGHHIKNVSRTEEWKNKMSTNMTGDKNNNWNPNRELVGRRGQNFGRKQRLRLLKSCCNECGSTEKLVLDHIIPVFAGGTNIDENAQTLCQKCNNIKRDIDYKHYDKKSGELKETPNLNRKDNLELSAKGNLCESATDRGRALGLINYGSNFLHERPTMLAHG